MVNYYIFLAVTGDFIPPAHTWTTRGTAAHQPDGWRRVFAGQLQWPRLWHGAATGSRLQHTQKSTQQHPARAGAAARPQVFPKSCQLAPPHLFTPSDSRNNPSSLGPPPGCLQSWVFWEKGLWGLQTISSNLKVHIWTEYFWKEKSTR